MKFDMYCKGSLEFEQDGINKCDAEMIVGNIESGQIQVKIAGGTNKI